MKDSDTRCMIFEFNLNLRHLVPELGPKNARKASEFFDPPSPCIVFGSRPRIR